jgi:beta-glucosidase
MIKKYILCLLVLALVLPAGATKISNATVDLIKGYQAKNVNSVPTYFYMGRLTYNFFSQGNDSVFVDFTITKQGAADTATIFEKIGDWGLVRQANATDTVKTVYFRLSLTNDVSGNFAANVTANGNISSMMKLADSVLAHMSMQQKLTSLYSWTTVTNLAGFGSDDIALSNGQTLVGWRSSDGPNGIRFPVTGPINAIAIYGSGNPATVFPTESARGCTWDTSMARQVGQAIGEEARANGLFCNLGPMSDLVINPRWGRAFETMGEDPYLVGKMASHQAIGIQSAGVIATPKHFTPYCEETDRMNGQRIIISERALRELPCVPFEMDIKEGGARAIMTCYNQMQVPGFTTADPTLIGELCLRAGSNRHLIDDILRHDWGFNGVIMTDWLGASGVDETYAFNTAFDMSMPNGDGFLNSVTNISNNISGWTIDTLNKKTLNTVYDKLWAWGGKLLPNDAAIATYPPQPPPVLCAAHLNLTLREARESIVLARNDTINGVSVLPLDKTKPMKIAVIGTYSTIYRPGGGGSSAVTPDSQISPIQGIKNLLAANPATQATITTDYTTADAAIIFVGVDVEEEGLDRATMTLSADQLALVTSVMTKVPRTIVVYTGGSASVAGSWSSAPGVIIAFYPGRNQAQAMAEILFGDVNPSGHLCVTFPNTVNDLPNYDLVNEILNYPSADTGAGYFYFEKTNKTPLYWFGHGLSYTSFGYTSMSIAGSTIQAGDRVDVVVSLKNTGAITGDQVVQLYVKPTSGSTVPRRIKDLRGFNRLTLAPGQEGWVKFTLGPRDFSYYNVNTAAQTGQWTVASGTYDIIAASTSNPADLVNGNGKCVIQSLTIQ